MQYSLFAGLSFFQLVSLLYIIISKNAHSIRTWRKRRLIETFSVTTGSEKEKWIIIDLVNNCKIIYLYINIQKEQYVYKINLEGTSLNDFNDDHLDDCISDVFIFAVLNLIEHMEQQS